jgi:hypothetical protein
VPDVAHLAASIQKITSLGQDERHLFTWNDVQSAASFSLKKLLTTAPLFLHFPIEGVPLHLSTGASEVATGGVLYQELDGQLCNVFYHPKVLLPTEQRYSGAEKEVLAILHCH